MEVVYFDTMFNTVCSGPVGIVSLLYICYGKFIPTSYYFKIYVRKNAERESAVDSESSHDDSTSITLPDSFQIHALFALLLFNNGFASFVPCIVGSIIGKLYNQELLAGSKNWVIPTPLFRLFVNPRKLPGNWPGYLVPWNGYSPVSLAVNDSSQPEVMSDTREQAEEEETEEAIDDINIRNPQERSATPARPLGRQFLDIFRA